MITFPMLILIVVPLVAGIESLFAKRENARAISILAGLCIGAFLWNVYSDWRISPISSIVLVVLATAPIIRLFRAGTEVLKQGLTAAVVTFVVLFVAWQGLLGFVVNAEVITDIQVMNPNGSAGTTLLVYHPGRSGYQKMLIGAFSEGLVSNGWRVEIATASKEAPTDLSGYDLLVLSAPTYDWGARETNPTLPGAAWRSGRPAYGRHHLGRRHNDLVAPHDGGPSQRSERRPGCVPRPLDHGAQSDGIRHRRLGRDYAPGSKSDPRARGVNRLR
jgi:hypothetical protein